MDEGVGGVGAVGALRQVSEALEHTLRQLADERDLFDAVIQCTGDAVIAVDAGGKIIVVNHSARELLELSGELRGRSVSEAVRHPLLSGVLDDALRGKPCTRDIELDAQGGARWLMVRGVAHGDRRGAFLIMHDMTEERRLEAARRDFVANVSHELRTPVSVIRANTETLLSGALEDPVHARRFLGAVRRNAERLGWLIGDLLAISRIDMGNYPIEMRPLSMRSVARAGSKSVSEACRKHGVTLAVEIHDELRVLADPGALEQVLSNLIENAVKYGPEGGTVEVAAFVEDGGRVRVEVRDEGPGLAPGQRLRVFERFYRVDPGRSRQMGGTGLGLAVVKKLIEAMGGEVGVDPRQPRGSTFWIRLGLAESVEPNRRDTHTLRDAAERSGAQAGVSTLGRIAEPS